MSNKPTILLAEDHQDTSDLLVFLLNQLDYQVVTTTSIADTLTQAESAKFNLVVVDSLLTDGTGTELCKRIRQRDHTTPILFYSGRVFQKDVDEALLAGAQKYLTKPVDNSLFCQTVTELITLSARA